MLSYAYKTLSLSEYKKMGTEKFENVEELYAKILSIGIPVLIRGGLSKEYKSFQETSNVVKGKIDINLTIKKNTLINKKIIINHEEFSENILLNQIIKATLNFLSRSSKISRKMRKIFLGFLPYFTEVSNIELNLNIWKKVTYNRQNIRYQFILDICRYLYEQLLIDESTKSKVMTDIQDEQKLSSLYEKFIYAFFKRDTNYSVSRPQIRWNVDDDFIDALPIMQTDIVLQRNEKTLIIDTKFYSENMVSRFEGGTAKQNSNNLYQIFSYINNWEKKSGEIVSGMLLYAKTRSLIQPNHDYNIKGNKIFIRSLDLQQEFEEIKVDLLKYTSNFLLE